MPALSGQALGAPPHGCIHTAYHDSSRPLGAPFVVCKRRRREAVAVRADHPHGSSKREERLWQSELAPRQPLARAPDSLKVASVLHSRDFDLDSSEETASERPAAGFQNPVSEKWRALPSRWKVVAATSLAFVICNMVNSAHLPPSARFSLAPARHAICPLDCMQRNCDTYCRTRSTSVWPSSPWPRILAGAPQYLAWSRAPSSMAMQSHRSRAAMSPPG